MHGSQNLKTLHCYNFETNTWNLEETFADKQSLEYPKGRAAFGCVQRDNLVFISGGRHYDETASEALDDLWSLDLNRMQWSQMSLRLPRPLYFHSMALSPIGDVYVFGGVFNDERMGDLYQATLFFPSLAELCWKAYKRTLSGTGKLRPMDLVQRGVPHQFVKRLFNFETKNTKRAFFKCDPS